MKKVTSNIFCGVLFFITTKLIYTHNVYTDIEYAKVDGISLLLDIYLPNNFKKSFPVIVWIHDGGWISGSKNYPIAV